MRSRVQHWPVVGVAVLVPVLSLPAVTAESLDLSVLVGSPWLRASVSFLLVLPVGAVVLARYGGLVDRCTDASMEQPLMSLVYGLLAHLMVFFASGVLSLQLTSVGLDQTVLSVGSTVVLGTVFLVFAGLGFAVAGTWLVEFRGEGRRWHGLLAVLGVGAAGWLLPVFAGLALWILLVSVGIGGATRKWIHAERTVESETGS